MRLLALSLLLASLFSCSTDIHNIDEQTVSPFVKSHFPKGIMYANGSNADLRMLEDRAIAFYFTSINNPQSLEVEELLQETAKKYDYRLSIVVVNAGSNTSGFQQKMARYGKSFFIVSEEASKVLTKKYKINVTPSMLVFGRDKKLVDEKAVDSLVDNFPAIPGHWE